MKLLFCSANPKNDLNLVAELEQVLRVINAGQWELIFVADVSVKKLIHEVKTSKPDIVHFCGHSDGDGLVFVNDTTHEASSISPDRFAKILREGKTLQAVVLNSCENFAIFRTLRHTANWGIGTTREATDAECIDFSRNFYTRLSENLDILDAYSYAIRRNAPNSTSHFHILKMAPRRDLRTLGMVALGVIALAILSIIAFNHKDAATPHAGETTSEVPNLPVSNLTQRQIRKLDTELAYRLADFEQSLETNEDIQWSTPTTYLNVLWFLDNASGNYPEFATYRFKALLQELKDLVTDAEKPSISDAVINAIKLEDHRDRIKARDPNQTENPPPEITELFNNILPGLKLERWTRLPEYQNRR